MTGNELREALAHPPSSPPAIVTDFFYERCVTLITGQTGHGKSVLGAQLTLSGSAGTTLFNQLSIPRPRRIYFLQAEGRPEEQYRRLAFMCEVIPTFNPDYIYWDATRVNRLITLRPSSFKQKIDQIGNAFKDAFPDVVVLDPIYKLTGGDIAHAEPALSLVDFSDELQAQFKCSIMMFHHPHRERHTIYGKKIDESDDYYGHSFIKNHVEVSYLFRQLTVDGLTSQLKVLKKREDNLLNVITLRYHPETYTCSMLPQTAPTTKREQVLAFLHDLALAGHSTTFKEITEKVGISGQFLRDLQVEYRKLGLISFHKTPGKDTVWEPHLLENAVVSV